MNGSHEPLEFSAHASRPCIDNNHGKLDNFLRVNGCPFIAGRFEIEDDVGVERRCCRVGVHQPFWGGTGYSLERLRRGIYSETLKNYDPLFSQTENNIILPVGSRVLVFS